MNNHVIMNDKKLNKKILFITHDISHYGASRSLQLLTKNFNEDFYLAIQNPIFKKNLDLNTVSKNFGVNKKNIFLLNLPSSHCVLLPKEPLKAKIARFIFNFRFLFSKIKINQFFKNESFDIIHLNSLTLCPIITKYFPFTIHAREYFINKNKIFFNPISYIKKSSGIIFIDRSTTIPFLSYSLNNQSIIPNPVDMIPLLKNWDRKKALEYLKIKENNSTIYSVIGRVDIEEDKGVGFLISSFKKIKKDNIILLIIGFATKETKMKCLSLIANDQRIILYGEIQDQGLIYSASDIILRGESEFRVGRTHLEALYSGCKIIIPGNAEDINDDSILSKFNEKITAYIPRNSESLENAIIKNIDYKRKNSIDGNAKEHTYYVKEFFQKIMEVINEAN